ncbi:MAG: PAS domain-containing protein [Rhodospirillales bacterium]|nr:PAS domain-containing protein [Rhodospirillales bacterium]
MKERSSRKTKAQLSEEIAALRRRVRELEFGHQEPAEGKPPYQLSEGVQRLYNEVGIGLCSFDTDLKYRQIDAWLAALNGMSAKDHLGRSIGEVHPYAAEAVAQHLRHVLETGEPIHGRTVEAETVAEPGKLRSFQHNYLPVRSEDGAVVGVTCVVEEITERKEAEEALRESEARLMAVTENSPSAISLKDLQGRYLLVNKQWRNLHNIPDGKALGKTAHELVSKEAADRFAAIDQQVLDTVAPVRLEREFPGVNHRGITLLTTKFPVVNEAGAVVGIGGFTTEITDFKQAEERTKESLEEKETLLQEIHHRVKNNLQVISSMLSLQAGAETDSRSIEALNDSRRRVLVMARIHESLHQSDDLASINARGYLDRIVGDTKASSGEDAKDISFRLDIDDIVFGMDQAIPCGQIVSELLFNSLKHAFPDGRSGTIEVSLRQKGKKIELAVADDGIGLAAEFDPRQSKSLGMKLVHALTLKLSGVVEFNGGDGTRVRITFPDKPS